MKRKLSPRDEEIVSLKASIEQMLGGVVKTSSTVEGCYELVVEKPHRVGNGTLVGLRVQGNELDVLRLAFRILDEQAA
jgi:hypothetical protein